MDGMRRGEGWMGVTKTMSRVGGCSHGNQWSSTGITHHLGDELANLVEDLLGRLAGRKRFVIGRPPGQLILPTLGEGSGLQRWGGEGRGGEGGW